MNNTPRPRLFDGPLAAVLAPRKPDGTATSAHLGWFGLYHNRTHAGGAILHCDQWGFCTAWYTPSTVRLTAAWTETVASCAVLALTITG